MTNRSYNLAFILFFLCLALTSIGQDENAFFSTNSSLTDRWLLEDGNGKAYRILPYKPIYMLPVNYTTDINNLPQSDNPINSATEPSDYNDTEFTFHLSFKARMGRINKSKKFKVDFWLAYTQLSKWQLYNAANSRPFRETNYEPEFLMVFPVKYRFLGLDGVYLAAGINHQSNGQPNPFSRSWNRITFQAGWEAENWSFVLNPWIRLPEEGPEDNNPDIEDYVGRAELLTVFSKNKNNLSLALRHSLRIGDDSRGSFRFQYNYQLKDNLFALLQVFHGYGENMIDYNHKQTTIGLGLSLVRWR